MIRVYSCHKTDKKNFKSLDRLGDAVSKLETFV